VQSGNGNLTIAAVYCPPHFTISEGQFMDFYNLLGDRFIAAGAIMPNTRTGDHAWPTDPRKVPDLIDFAVHSPQ